MELYIDIGNTTIEFAVFEDENPKRVLVILTKEFNRHKKDILNLLTNRDITRIFISSVVPEIYKKLVKVLLKQVDKNSIVSIGPRESVNLKIDIEFPDELGTDLLCDMEGAIKLYEAPILIIDCGTATKIMYVPENKVFSSCTIIPGIDISFDLLNSKTSLLSKETLSEPKPFLDCHNTRDVIVSSIVFSHVDAIEGMIRRYEEQIGYKPLIVITGGYADFLMKYIKLKTKYEPSLAFIGLREICRGK